MKNDRIEILIRNELIRSRQEDLPRIRSMIMSSQNTALTAKKVPLNEISSTLIFREIYEAIRQLGDAKWWLSGFEPMNHEVSIEILKDFKINESMKLNRLVWFKQIRNDANYRGYIVSISQAKEIIDFWNSCSSEIIKILEKELEEATKKFR